MQQLINDSIYLQTFNNITKNEIIELTSLIKNHELCFEFYINLREFNDNELINLLESFQYLQCFRIIDILIIMKNHDKNKYFKEYLNKYLLNDYEKIENNNKFFQTISKAYNNSSKNSKTFLDAIVYGSLDLIKYYFKIYDIQNNILQWSFDISVKNDNLDVYLYIISIYIKTANDYRLISYFGSTTILKYLLDNNILTNSNIETILMYSALKNQCKNIKLLIDYNANIHFENEELLLISIEHNYYDLAKLLLENGSNIYIHNRRNCALNFVKTIQNNEMIKLINQYK